MSCAINTLPYTAFAHEQDIEMSSAIAAMPEARWLSYQLRKMNFEKAALSRVLHRGLLVSEVSNVYELAGEICSQAGISQFDVAIGEWENAHIVGVQQPIAAIPKKLIGCDCLPSIITQLAMHVKCAHLPILLLAEFAQEYVERLDVGSSVMVRLNTAIRKWRVFALMSTDRAVTLTGEYDSTLKNLIGQVDNDASIDTVVDQGRALCSDCDDMGILCESLASPSLGDKCIAQRVYDLSEWCKSKAYEKIISGEYISTQDAGSTLWGGFAGDNTGWESETIEDFAKPSGMYNDMSDAVKSIAGEFGGVAQQGISVLSQTATSFIDALSKELKKDKPDG